jgi:hypothetical protein
MLATPGAQEVAMQQNRYWDFRECRWVQYYSAGPRVPEAPPVPLPREETTEPVIAATPPEPAPPPRTAI